jgi:hypothetical protein
MNSLVAFLLALQLLAVQSACPLNLLGTLNDLRQLSDNVPSDLKPIIEAAVRDYLTRVGTAPADPVTVDDVDTYVQEKTGVELSEADLAKITTAVNALFSTLKSALDANFNGDLKTFSDDLKTCITDAKTELSNQVATARQTWDTNRATYLAAIEDLKAKYADFIEKAKAILDAADGDSCDLLRAQSAQAILETTQRLEELASASIRLALSVAGNLDDLIQAVNEYIAAVEAAGDPVAALTTVDTTPIRDALSGLHKNAIEYQILKGAVETFRIRSEERKKELKDTLDQCVNGAMKSYADWAAEAKAWAESSSEQWKKDLAEACFSHGANWESATLTATPGTGDLTLTFSGLEVNNPDGIDTCVCSFAVVWQQLSASHLACTASVVAKRDAQAVIDLTLVGSSQSASTSLVAGFFMLLLTIVLHL